MIATPVTSVKLASASSAQTQFLLELVYLYPQIHSSKKEHSIDGSITEQSVKIQKSKYLAKSKYQGILTRLLTASDSQLSLKIQQVGPIQDLGVFHSFTIGSTDRFSYLSKII